MFIKLWYQKMTTVYSSFILVFIDVFLIFFLVGREAKVIDIKSRHYVNRFIVVSHCYVSMCHRVTVSVRDMHKQVKM